MSNLNTPLIESLNTKDNEPEREIIDNRDLIKNMLEYNLKSTHFTLGLKNFLQKFKNYKNTF